MSISKYIINVSKIILYVVRTVLLKGNVALARNFLSSRRNHSIEQRVGRIASQANTRLDTLELASFNSARCEDLKVVMYR